MGSARPSTGEQWPAGTKGRRLAVAVIILMAASTLAVVGASPAVAADTGARVAITEGGGINASSAGGDALTVENVS
ncbi:MAG: hypothetical protein OES57_19230, partial [Acidimicrobiia bacterium]|nr:hypothetical protein [Acidimicrobiia bacterium]